MSFSRAVGASFSSPNSPKKKRRSILEVCWLAGVSEQTYTRASRTHRQMSNTWENSLDRFIHKWPMIGDRRGGWQGGAATVGGG